MGNKFGLKVLEIKALCIIAVLIFVVATFIGTTSALDVGDPDISVKILAPDELMPNSTYFLGIKYMVNATFWGADPAIDPEIIFNVENGEIIEKLSGRFKAVSTSQSCTFRLDGEIAEKRNETVVVIIKTGSSGSVNIDLTARAHDSDNYNHIITTTNPISIPIKKLNPNSVEYFKELAEQRKTLFEQYLYLVNETLMGTTSEVEKMNDEAMQTALLKTTSACYNMALGEFISSGAGSFLDPITGIAGTYEYMDFTNEAINGFEGNPLFAAVGWIFNWCDYVINKMVLDMDIRILFGHGFTGPDYYLNQYSSLIDEEIACWDNNDFNGLKNVLGEEKGFWSYKDAYLRVSSGINDYESLPEDTRTYVKLLYKSVGNSIDADCRLVHEYIEPAIKEPKPRFISIPSNVINLGKGDEYEYELVFKIKNDGGTASASYFSLSISDGLNITDNSSDKPNGVFSIYHRGALIWYRDEYQIPASYTLLDWYRPWLSAGEEQTINVKIKGEERGDQWVKYRLAFKPMLEDLSFVRNPLSGELDQQGWHAYKINVHVTDITNQEPNADFSYLVDGLSVGFTSLSRDPDEDALDYYWDFDDGLSSTEENPTHEYENGGDYSVTLTATDAKGLSDYKTRDIHVNEKPKADFVYSVNGTDVTFVSTSMDDGAIVSWEWDFGDGERGSGEVVSHTYSSVGSYEVNLTVTDDDGVTDSATKEITIEEIFVPEEEWNKTFGGTDTDVAYSVQQTSDGGYILAGYTYSYGAGDGDFWLVETDAEGNEEWNKTFGGTDFDGAHSVQQTFDDGYILAGHTSSYGAGSWDFWLVKTDSNGNKEWDKTFGGTCWDWANSMQQTSDGGYILAGLTDSYGAGSWDAWLIKTDSNGNKEWNKTFGGTGGDEAYSVRQTSDGGYILVGSTKSYGAGLGDFWLVKTDSNGNKQWDKTFGGTDYDRAASVQQTSDGGYILAGSTGMHGAGLGDVWLVKTDSNGNKEWDKTFGGTNEDWASSVQQTSDGGYILAGSTKSYGAGSCDVWLVKTDSNGKKEWDKTFGGTDYDRAASVQQTSDGGYILAGCTESYGAGSNDVWLIKVKGELVEEACGGLVKFTSNATTFYRGYTDKWFNPNWWYDLRDDVDRQATYRAALGDFVNSPLTSAAGLVIGDTVLGAVNSILGLFSYFMQFVDAFFSFIAVETYDAAGLIVAQAPNFQYIHQDLNNLIINEAAIEEAISVGNEGRLEDLLEGRKAILEELYSKLDDYDASIYKFTIDHALDHNYSTGKWGYGYALIKDFTIVLHLELQGDYIYTSYQLNRIHGSNDFEKLNEVVKDGYIRPTRYDIGPYSSHIIGCLDDLGDEAKFVINLRPEEIEGDRGLVILEAKNEGMMLYLEKSSSNDKWSGRDIKITDPTPGIYNLTVNATKNPGLYHLVAYTKDFNPLHFESDIASVNITPVGVEVQYPRPKVVAIQVNKNETSLNEEVILTVNVTNDGGTANWQSIAVSSPDVINVDSYTILSHNLDYFEKYAVGYETGCDYGNDTKTLTYPLIEGAKNDWRNGFNGELKLKIKPEKEGNLRVYVKSVAYGSGVWRSAPKIYEMHTKDQQNEYVYVKSIVVTNEEPGKTEIVINCPVNTTITNQYNTIISDKGTNEIPNASMLITNETKIFYQPAELNMERNCNRILDANGKNYYDWIPQ